MRVKKIDGPDIFYTPRPLAHCCPRRPAVLGMEQPPPDLLVAEESHPAYPVDSEGDKVGGPQCSQFKDVFCFFCEYANSTPQDEGSDIDLRGTLVSLVNTLNREKREISHIVEAVHDRYHAVVRPHVPDEPAWHISSIRRHLLYSTEFAFLFDGIVTQVFQSVICNIQEHMMDDDNTVNDKRLKQFLDTVKEYRSWSKDQLVPAAKKART